MSLSDLAAVGSFIGGLAVLGSLIFVGFQLRQNTQAVRAGASQAHSHNWLQITMQVVESGDFARVWRLGVEDIESLTDDERVRFYAYAGAALRFFEGARLQWRHGQLDKEHWHNVEKTATDFAATSGFKSYWAARHHWLSPEFQNWYESLSKERAHELYGKPAVSLEVIDARNRA
jgi:hypothetical protein